MNNLKTKNQITEKITTNGSNVNMYITPEYKWQYEKIKFENYSAELVLERVKNNSTFLDIGAHYGFFSCLVGSHKKNIKVISIEPVPKNFKILNKNLLENKINSKTYNIAASNKNSSIKFNIAKVTSRSSFYKTQFSEIDKTIFIKTKILDELIKEKINFIKIDVEGHEIETLEGLKNTFIKNPQLEMLIEFNPNSQISANKDPKELLKKLIDLNFDIYSTIDYPWQKPEKENESYSDIRELYKVTNCINNWEKFVNINHHVNLLCIPKNKSKLITFFSHSSQLAGAERSMIELIKELKEKNIFSHVVLPNEGPLQKELENINIPYDIVNLNWWASNNTQTEEEITLNNKISTENLINYLSKLSSINPDLIYSNTIVSPWGAVAANQLNKPHIWHVREYGDLDHGLKFNLGYEETIKFIENNSDLIITNSKSVSDHISKYLNYKKPEVVYNHVEISKKYLKEKNQNPYKNMDSLKIIICGNIHPGKNQLEGIKAINELIKKNINVELLILGTTGDKQYLNEILDYIKANNIENNIIILDFVKNPYPFIKSSDIVLISSIKEAYGRTAVEGMLLQKVVVASDGGGTKEIIKNGETGFVYKSGNIKELEEILTKITDKKIQNKIGFNGFNSLKEFNSKEKYGYKIAELIKKLPKKNKNKLFQLVFKILINLEENNKRLEENNKTTKLIQKENLEIKELEASLKKIRSAKFFKLWRMYIKLIKKQ